MATIAQLTAEPWWNREIVTDELSWLGDELCRRTGRPADAAGDKGNTVHLRGSHRSQEWIKNSAYCTDRSYTVQSGLTAEQLRHVAGFDFTPGSAEAMIAQCKRLMAALKSGQLEEVREFYGNVDGDQVVDGWNNLADRAATSDSSHLWHWHISFDRRQVHNRALMERIVHIALGDPISTLEDDMAVGVFYTIVKGGPGYDGRIWYLPPGGAGRVYVSTVDVLGAMREATGATTVTVPSAAVLDLLAPLPVAVVPADLVARLDAILAAASNDGDVTVQMSPEALAEVTAIRDAVAAVPQATADLVHADLAD